MQTLNLQLIPLLWHYLPKIGVATLCGLLVGYERGRRNKTAGVKTNVIICVGSALFTATTILLASLGGNGSDINRGVAQIISGIGFLGAGAIIKTKQDVHGLTTASLIWLMGAIGVIIGAGWLALSIIITTGFVAMTQALTLFEQKFVHRRNK